MSSAWCGRSSLIALQERIEAGLLLQDIGGGGMRRFRLQSQMHALVSPVLFGMAGRDPLEPNAEAQPPDRELAEPVERMGRSEGHAVVGTNRVGQAEVLEGALEDGKGIALRVVDCASQAIR